MSSKKKKKNAQDIPTCVFCGNTPLTREHLWPVWMKGLHPRDGINSHETLTEYFNVLDKNAEENNYKLGKTTGHPGSTQVKKFCGACNSGWMSQIENQTRPILTSIILGEPVNLTLEDQEQIARWAFLKSIVAEYLDPISQVITPAERRWFKDMKTIPPHWSVWISRAYPPDWNYILSQKRGVFDYRVRRTTLMSTNYSKSILFNIGELVVYVAKFKIKEWDEGFFNYAILGENERKLIKIHPSKKSKIHWHQTPTMNELDIHILNNNLIMFINNLREYTQRY